MLGVIMLVFFLTSDSDGIIGTFEILSIDEGGGGGGVEFNGNIGLQLPSSLVLVIFRRCMIYITTNQYNI